MALHHWKAWPECRRTDQTAPLKAPHDAPVVDAAAAAAAAAARRTQDQAVDKLRLTDGRGGPHDQTWLRAMRWLDRQSHQAPGLFFFSFFLSFPFSFFFSFLPSKVRLIRRIPDERAHDGQGDKVTIKLDRAEARGQMAEID